MNIHNKDTIREAAMKRLKLTATPEQWRDLPRQNRFFDCARHGWSCMGTPCPQCAHDAPRHCLKHGWSHSTKGCPKCATGQP